MPKKRERPLLQHMEVGDNAPAYHPAPDGDSPDRPTVVPAAGAPRYTPPTNSCGDPFPRLSPEGASKGQDHSPPGDSKPTSPTSPTVPSVAVKQPIRGLPTIGKDSSETSLLVPDSSIITDEGSQVETAVIDPEEIGHMTLWNGQRIKVDEFIKREKNKHEMYRPISDLYCCLRMWSFVGHFGVLVCLPVLLWLVFTRAGRKLEESVEDHLTHKLWFTTPVALTAIFMGLSYLLILCEVCISRTRPYIANLMHIDEARLYVRDMRKVAPRILLKVTCYHYADNNRGKTYKKVTYEDKQEFRFSYCQDASGTLRREDFEEGMATKVKMRRVFGFLDEDTEQRYKTFKNNLIAKHTPKDFYIDIEEIVEIDGLRDKISVYPEEDSRPNCMQYKYYWISAICFLTLPYRYWFNRHTRKSSFTFIKLIKG